MLITVGWYLNPVDAHIARGCLDSAGIPTFLHSVNHSHLDWSLTLALGGIRLQVPSAAVEESRELLQSMQVLEKDEGEVCPVCGSKNLFRSELSWRLALFVVHFLHIPLPFRRYEMACRDCSARWH